MSHMTKMADTIAPTWDKVIYCNKKLIEEIVAIIKLFHSKQ